MVNSVVLPTPRRPNTPIRCGRHRRWHNSSASERAGLVMAANLTRAVETLPLLYFSPAPAILQLLGILGKSARPPLTDRYDPGRGDDEAPSEMAGGSGGFPLRGLGGVGAHGNRGVFRGPAPERPRLRHQRRRN